MLRIALLLLVCVVALVVEARADALSSTPGYFRFPALSDDGIVFTAEGDLVARAGARRRCGPTHEQAR